MHSFSPMSRVSRRALLKGAAGLAMVAGFPGLGVAQEKTLVVANWGGDWNDRTMKFVEIPLVESRGIKIVRDISAEPERKAKLVAEKRLRRGSIDVAQLNQGDAFEMASQDVLAPLDFSRIPNAAEVPAPLKTSDYFVPWLYSAVVIAYNTKTVNDPPKSYAALADARWKGRIGLTNQVYFNYVMMGSLVGSGTVADSDAGFKFLARLKEVAEPKIYATHQQLQAALANGEVDLAVNYKARLMQWINEGVPLAVQYPAEGAIAVMFGAGMPKKAPNPDLAYIYFNAMLDPKAMADIVAVNFYSPANPTLLPPDLKARIDFTPQEQNALKFPDYAYVAKNTANWLDWWNKNITR